MYIAKNYYKYFLRKNPNPRHYQINVAMAVGIHLILLYQKNDNCHARITLFANFQSIYMYVYTSYKILHCISNVSFYMSVHVQNNYNYYMFTI